MFSVETSLLFCKENLFPAHRETGSPFPFLLLTTFGWQASDSAIQLAQILV